MLNPSPLVPQCSCAVVLLLLQSMALEKQTAALKDAITAPLLKAKDLLVKDIREHDELLDEPE
jgi:hypothetical protein